MNRQSFVQMQALESRRLLSGAGPGLHAPAFLDDPTIQADLQELQKDQKQFRKDRRTTAATIEGDRKAVNDELQHLRDTDENLQTELQPLQDQVKADIKARNKELRTDYAALEDGTADTRETVHQDLIQLRKDKRAGDAEAVTADKAKLAADRTVLEDASKPFTDEIKADQAKWKTTLADDRQAIQDKLVELDPALKDLFAKLETDQSSAKTKLDADRAAVQADLDKLHDDLEALKNANSRSGT